MTPTFNHANILHLGDGRPFDDIGHHDEMLILNWNSVVGVDDVVIHLGDVALGPWSDGLDKVERLNGYKILVPGNHDRISSVESEKRRERFLPDYERVFDEIWPEVSPVKVGEYIVEVSHYPLVGDSHDGDRFTRLRGLDYGVARVHGHTHCSPDVRESFTDSGTPQLAVGVDAWDWTPVHESAVNEWLDRVWVE